MRNALLLLALVFSLPVLSQSKNLPEVHDNEKDVMRGGVYEVVKTQKVNVRKKADVKSAILGTLQKGERVDVISTQGNWAEIAYLSSKAYVSLTYLKCIENVSLPPVLDEKEITVQTEQSVVVDAATDVASFYGMREKKDSLNIPSYFITVKYDRMRVEKSKDKYNYVSLGALSNPFDREGKKSSWTYQVGGYIDYCWFNKTQYKVNTTIRYVGLTVPLHLLGWQFSDGQGHGISLHGGFEFTCRIGGRYKQSMNGEELSSLNAFDKDDMQKSCIKHFGVGFGGAVDVSLSDFYASVGYKFIVPFLKDINTYGPYFVIGYTF